MAVGHGRLDGAPDWVVADLDPAIARAVRETRAARMVPALRLPTRCAASPPDGPPYDGWGRPARRGARPSLLVGCRVTLY
jgi:hypothetical protein